MKDLSGKTFEQLRSVNFKAYSQQLIETLEVIIYDQMIMNSFFRDLEVVDLSNASVTISFNSHQAIEIAKRDYQPELNKAVEDVFQKNLAIIFSLKGQNDLFTNAQEVGSKNLSKKFLFKNYVEADFNSEAVQIGKKIVNNIGVFSPFFLVSKSGLGKTHLLHAIGNALTENNYSCIYVDPNTFTKEITKLSKDAGALLKYTEELQKYDVLIFDDIQNLGDRSVSLKVLLNLINHHLEEEKQIIIASDKSPKELSGFESRFITRFNSGLTSIISDPSIADLVKILEKKLDWNGMNSKNWEQEALKFIARNNSTSIRSIEGAIKRVVFFTGTSSNIQYTVKVVANIFKELTVDPKELTPQRIIQVVATYYKISIKDIVGKSRKQQFVIPRHMSIWLIKKIIKNISLIDIGKIFGGRDHTTIIASIRKIEMDIEINDAVKMAANKIEQNIKTIS